jgi:hypothetical protein
MKDVSVNIRMTQEMKAQIEFIALQEERSLSKQILIYIKSCTNATSIAQALPKHGLVTKKVQTVAIKPDYVDKQIWHDFIALRKTKRSPLTQTAMNGIEREAQKANVTVNDALAMCCARGWQSFKAEWAQDKSKSEPSWVTEKKNWLNEMTGKSERSEIIEMETNNLRLEK